MISFIICANSRWGDYAGRFIESLYRNEEKHFEVILVDNGSPVPYQAEPGFELVRLEQKGDYNYMLALNTGAALAKGDWLVFCNDDIMCQGRFFYRIEGLVPDAIYGMELRRKDRDWGLEFKYIYGWMLIVPRKVWDATGLFDEYYLHAGFDDLDYCWRAQQLGFAVQTVDLPFIHLADQRNIGSFHRRAVVQGFHENMKRSKEHFLKKVHEVSNVLPPQPPE